MSKQIPVTYWAPLASAWLALAALAVIAGNIYATLAAVASIALLGLSLRLETLQRQRHAVLATTVALLDAKVDARIRKATTHDRP